MGKRRIAYICEIEAPSVERDRQKRPLRPGHCRRIGRGSYRAIGGRGGIYPINSGPPLLLSMAYRGNFHIARSTRRPIGDDFPHTGSPYTTPTVHIGYIVSLTFSLDKLHRSRYPAKKGEAFQV